MANRTDQDVRNDGHLSDVELGRLRGGSRRRDRIRIAPGAAGIERLEVHLHGQAFSPHRHDTYTIGLTVAGVQSFRFRGRRWHCLPGQCQILHPDELHDGGAGTDEGFGYRVVYIDPALVQEALHGRTLPFVAEPVVDAGPLLTEIWDIEAEIDDVARVELVVAVSGLLARAARAGKPASRLSLEGLKRVREMIGAAPTRRHTMSELERVADLDRWTLARQFRAAFGTSPTRFRTLRQLDLARKLLRERTPLAEAAIRAGFADQSHMSRQFKRAYGITPARWVAALA